jgi:hypothetical protein
MKEFENFSNNSFHSINEISGIENNMVFIKNCDQLQNNDILFYSQNGEIWFTKDAVWFELREEINFKKQRPEPSEEDLLLQTHNYIQEQIRYQSVILKQQFIGANDVEPIGKNKTDYFSNFFYGNDSSKWRSNVQNFREIIYENIYDGINLKYYSNENGLKYDFIIHPNADISQIRIRYEGAEKLEIDGQGNLVIKTTVQDLTENELFIYQHYDNFRHPVKGRFRLFNDYEYAFEIRENYRSDEILIIDPEIELEFSTFIGCGSYDFGRCITVDNQRNSYITGRASSQSFPKTGGVYDRTYNGGSQDLFVLKFNPICSKIIYSTFVGGGGYDRMFDIEVDIKGNVYITGNTESNDFPTTFGAFDRTANGGVVGDAFAFKLNETGGSLMFSTFLGGQYSDYGWAIDFDNFGNVYVTGHTDSPNFPITNDAYDKTHDNTWYDIFLAKFNHNASKLNYSTFIGGDSGDRAIDIILLKKDIVILSGHTYSSNFPTTSNANDTSHNGKWDVFVMKFNITNSSLIYSTFIGAGNEDQSWGLDIDLSGNAYITGRTNSNDFPTTQNALNTSYNGGYDIFVTKLNKNGSSIIFSTFIGGGDYEIGTGIEVDGYGNSFVCGYTDSSNFPVTSNAYQKKNGEYADVFLFKMAANGSALIYSTYFRGSGSDKGFDITLDNQENAYITGETWSYGFPTTPGVYDTSYNTDGDAFVFKFIFNRTLKLKSFSVLKNNSKTTKLFAKIPFYVFRVNITDTPGLKQLKTVNMILDPLGSNIQFQWDRNSGQFTKINDPLNYVDLEQSSKAYNNSINTWILDFNLTFNWTYPDEDLHDICVQATSKSFPKLWMNTTGAYQVENDLMFTGNLSVKDETNQEISENELIGGGEQLTWTNLTTVYEGTTDVFPPKDEYKILLSDDDDNSWKDSPNPGVPFNIIMNTPDITKMNGYNYTIQLNGIPPECDKTDEAFKIRIDGDNVIYLNPTPNNKTWKRINDVLVGIEIQDIGGGTVIGSSVGYSTSTDNGSTWKPWKKLVGLESSERIKIQKEFSFPDGSENLIKWQATDSVGNGPTESESYRILVDTENIKFIDPWPINTDVSPVQTVNLGITITDDTSGINASSMEYAISTDDKFNWQSWERMEGFENGNIIIPSLNLTLPNGTLNWIKWRAMDIAGNGPVESEAYNIRINTWLRPYVKLQSPYNNTILPTNTVELSWTVMNSDPPNVTYELYLSNTFPPIRINKSELADLDFTAIDLIDGETYYWTVIPITEKSTGFCSSGIWSFTVDIPEIALIAPVNGSNISSTAPTLMWAVNYSGLELITYDIFYWNDTSPEKRINDYFYNSYSFSKKISPDIYYWKIIAKIGNKLEIESEKWSFNIRKEDLPKPIIDIELEIIPQQIEVKPNSQILIKAIVTNLGENIDIISLTSEVELNTSIEISIIGSNSVILDYKSSAVFDILISFPKEVDDDYIIVNFIAESNNAKEYNLDVKKNETLIVKIIDENHVTKSDHIDWTIYIAITIIVILIIIFLLVFQRIRSKDESQSPDVDTISDEESPSIESTPEEPETASGLEPEAKEGPEIQTPAELDQITAPNTEQIPMTPEKPQLPPAPKANQDDN